MIHKTCLLLILSSLVFSCNDRQALKDFQIQQGDLLFQNTGSGEIDKAIKDVTSTSQATNYSHVGIAMNVDSTWYVLEAIPNAGVCQTPLKEFLDRNKNQFDKSKTVVARLDAYYYSCHALEWLSWCF